MKFVAVTLIIFGLYISYALSKCNSTTRLVVKNGGDSSSSESLESNETTSESFELFESSEEDCLNSTSSSKKRVSKKSKCHSREAGNSTYDIICRFANDEEVIIRRTHIVWFDLKSGRNHTIPKHWFLNKDGTVKNGTQLPSPIKNNTGGSRKQLLSPKQQRPMISYNFTLKRPDVIDGKIKTNASVTNLPSPNGLGVKETKKLIVSDGKYFANRGKSFPSSATTLNRRL